MIGGNTELPEDVRKKLNEDEYLELLHYVYTEGKDRGDRTGTGTRSVFSGTLNMDLRNGFPLLTTKKMAWKSIVGELLWFLSGKTDLASLRQFTHGVNDPSKFTIWDKDIANWHEQRGRNGFAPESGGFLYGSQWRSFSGASGDWATCDQIDTVLKEAERNPESRRLLVSAWNSADIQNNLLALPPCHFAWQLYIEDGVLNMKWNQRSVDLFLGCGFNIASYALLLCIFAKWLNLKPGQLIGDLTNVHIYHNHFEQVEEQLSRNVITAPDLPKIPKKFELHNVHRYIADDFPLPSRYMHHDPIKAEMASGNAGDKK